MSLDQKDQNTFLMRFFAGRIGNNPFTSTNHFRSCFIVLPKQYRHSNL